MLSLILTWSFVKGELTTLGKSKIDLCNFPIVYFIKLLPFFIFFIPWYFVWFSFIMYLLYFYFVILLLIYRFDNPEILKAYSVALRLTGTKGCEFKYFNLLTSGVLISVITIFSGKTLYQLLYHLFQSSYYRMILKTSYSLSHLIHHKIIIFLFTIDYLHMLFQLAIFPLFIWF